MNTFVLQRISTVSVENPKFCGSAHFRSKTASSPARLKILQAAEHCELWSLIITKILAYVLYMNWNFNWLWAEETDMTFNQLLLIRKKTSVAEMTFRGHSRSLFNGSYTFSISSYSHNIHTLYYIPDTAKLQAFYNKPLFTAPEFCYSAWWTARVVVLESGEKVLSYIKPFWNTDRMPVTSNELTHKASHCKNNSGNSKIQCTSGHLASVRWDLDTWQKFLFTKSFPEF